MLEQIPASKTAQIRSVSDFVYNTICRAILTNQLPGGSRLVEAKMAKELNVSITPVREAFAELSNQGLLTVFPYKGTYVTYCTKEFVRDVSYIRKNLEAMAAECGFFRMTDEQIRLCEQLSHESDVEFCQGNLSNAIHLDVLFHEQMFLASGNSLLLELWNSIKYRVEYIQSYAKPVMKSRMMIRHKGMQDSLRTKDLDAYMVALTEHLSTSVGTTFFPSEQDVSYN